MAKTMTQDKTSSDQGSKKQRKKLAKQEARLMLKVEEAKKAAQKAEAKAAKAQTGLQDANDKLHALEEQLTKLRGNEHQHSQKKQGKRQHDTGDSSTQSAAQMPLPSPISYNSDGQNGRNTEAKEQTMEQQDQSNLNQEPTNQLPTQPPAEGRTDIPQQSTDTGSGMSADSGSGQQSSFANTGQGGALEIDSDDGSSMPILSNNPQAWPPPQTREEVAEGVVEEVQHPHSSSGSDASFGNAGDTGSDAPQAGPDQTQLEQRYGEQSE